MVRTYVKLEVELVSCSGRLSGGMAGKPVAKTLEAGTFTFFHALVRLVAVSTWFNIVVVTSNQEGGGCA
jgi:hypothetical protein